MDKVNQLLTLFGMELVPAPNQGIMSKTGKAYYGKILAGFITESDAGYKFAYHTDYLAYESAKPISLTMKNQPIIRIKRPLQFLAPF